MHLHPQIQIPNAFPDLDTNTITILKKDIDQNLNFVKSLFLTENKNLLDFIS